MINRAFIVLVVSLCSATIPACLFDTRKDEVIPPDTGGSTISLDAPEKVFVAITQSLTARQDANYERAISTTFIFSPTLTDSLDQNFIGTGVYDNWNKDREMEVVGRLLADAQTVNAQFFPSVEFQQTTFVRFRVDYELDVINTVAPTVTARYRGVAFFDVRRETGNWRLTYWDEIETVEGFPTWGFLRGVLGLQLSP